MLLLSSWSAAWSAVSSAGCEWRSTPRTRSRTTDLRWHACSPRPLFSGLAGIGGVVLTGVLTQLADNGQTVNLPEMFVLKPVHLVLAAVFGLAPARFFDRLGQAEQPLANLRSTEVMNVQQPASRPGA